MRKEIDRRLGLQAAGAMLPWTVFDADGQIAGMTTYMNVDAANRRLKIGSTWYAKRVQRSALNTQCKLMLFDPRLRRARLHRGRIPHAFLQSSKAGAASRGCGGQARRGFCAAIRSRPTARCATPSFTASSPANGRRFARI